MANLIGSIFGAPAHGRATDFGLLLARLSVGLMMAIGHGWGKLMKFGERAATFPDPLGVGSQLSMGLTVFAEFFCSLALVFGIATRWAALPPLITMLVAVLVIHAADPWSKQEFPLLYATIYVVIAFAGAGRWSVDGVLTRNLRL